MRKQLFGALAVVGMLFATSCAKDATEAQVAPEGNDAAVSFAVDAPILGSRANYGDGTTANRLAVLVYHKEADGTYKYNATLSKFDIDIPLHTTVTIEKLVKGETYNFYFWACAPDATEFVAEGADAANDKLFALTLADGNVVVNYGVGKSNNEQFDAFFASVLKLSVSGAVTRNVTLKRPFAQVNIGTDDIDAVLAQGGADAMANAISSLSLSMYNKFSLKDGSVDETTFARKSITYGNIPTGTLTVNGTAYTYLLMDYVLVPGDKIVEPRLGIVVKQINGISTKSMTITNVPLQRNYRTNIVGSLFTSEANFNVVIDPLLYDFDVVIADGGNLSSLKYASTATISGAINDRVSIDAPSGSLTQVITLDNATITNPDNNSRQTFSIGKNVNTTFKGTGTIKACSNPSGNTSVIEVQSSTGVVNIYGDDNLIIDGGSGSKTNNCIYLNTGTVNIYGGYFKAGLDVNGYQNACVLADAAGSYGKGIVNIYGGTFINETSTAAGDTTKVGVLNIQDGTAAQINVYGGIFVGQDPAEGDNSGTPSTFVVAGHHSNKLSYQIDGKDVWEVVAD